MPRMRMDGLRVYPGAHARGTGVARKLSASRKRNSSPMPRSTNRSSRCMVSVGGPPTSRGCKTRVDRPTHAHGSHRAKERAMATTATAPALIYRHRLPVRIMHWINVACVLALLGSGLQIFNAHPALYWGDDSRDSTQVLRIGQRRDADRLVGVTRVGRQEFVTDGVLGVSRGPDGAPAARAFPPWATIPGNQWLAMGRLWHFFFAWVFVINGLCYLLWTVATGHLRDDLVPTRREWRGIGRSVLDHLRLRHPHGEEARRYNVLQNIAYLAILFIVL